VASEQRVIESWAELRRDIESIVDRLNASPALALAAAANPLLALAELGYEIDPAARPAIEDRLRFGQPGAKRLNKLRGEIFKHAGHPFDPTDEQDVTKVLDELGVKVDRRKRLSAQRPSASKPRAVDPLETLKGKHPIIEPMLEYREIDRSEPRLADDEVYASVREGRVELPVTRVRGVLKAEGQG
jgi:hypothetical protein